MIRTKFDSTADIASYKSIWEKYEPGNRYIIIDNFFENVDLLHEAHQEFYQIPIEYWEFSDQHPTQYLKRTYPNMFLPKNLSTIFEYIQSTAFISTLSSITGLKDLIPDLGLYGAGLHVTSSTGFLGTHVDRPYDAEKNRYRRLNFLLYMNPVWKTEWNGELEIYDKNCSRILESVQPIFNRLVLLETPLTPHGHAKPLTTPDNIERLSIASYYYTHEPPRVIANQLQSNRAEWKFQHEAKTHMPCMEDMYKQIQNSYDRAKERVLG